MVKMKKCPGCKRELELNTDNFHRNRSSRNGFTPRCKDCRKERAVSFYEKERLEREEEKTLRDMELRHEDEIEKALEGLNSRNHKPIPVNKDCTVKRLIDKHSRVPGGRYLKGKFVEVYDSYLVFQTRQGWRECFKKNDLEISWTVEHKNIS